MPIKNYLLRVLADLENDPTYRKTRGKGTVRDLKKACKEHPYLKGRKNAYKYLKSYVYRARKKVSGGGYLKELDAAGSLVRYVSSIEEFGNIKGKSGFNALADELLRLRVFGQSLEDTNFRLKLQRRFHVKKKELLSLWEQEGKAFKDWTPQDFQQARKWYQIMESKGDPKEQPSKVRRAER